MSNPGMSPPAPGPPHSQPATARRIGPDGTVSSLMWQLAEEVPAAVLYNGQFFAVMMVTPADLEDFAVGFSVTEGIVERAGDIADVRIAEAHDGWAINIKIPAARADGIATRRRVLTGRSGCGICGAQTLDAAVAAPRPVVGEVPEAAAIARALAAFPAHQPMNALNRSTHAAGFALADGALAVVREDVGRHNALDKVAGALLRAGDRQRAGLLAGGFLVMSSRCSMELVQKAAMLGISTLASVSAPTALAVRLAASAGMTLAARHGDAIVVFDPPP